MVKKPIITGIFSYGMSGRVFHAPFIDHSEFFELRAVVERSKKVAQQHYPDVISYDTVGELLADETIELVIINTPNDTHYAYASQALLAGKHILMEKPFTPTVEEAKKLFSLGKKVGRKVLPFHNRRFDSDFLSLKYILEKGFVGKPIELHLRFDRFTPQLSAKTFKETKSRAANGVLYDLGSHLLDQVISLFGKPKSITKIQSIHRKKSQVSDYASLILNYKDGLNVFITTSLLVANAQKSFVLHGTEGSYVKDRTDVQERQLLQGIQLSDPLYGVEENGADGILTIIADQKREDIYVAPLQGNYMQLFDSVYQAIRNDTPYFVTAEQILWQLEILMDKK